MHQRCMCFAFQEALMLKGRGKLTKIAQPQNEELSSNFIRPKQTVYKMSFATVSRSGTTFLPHQAPPTSKNIRKPGPKEVRLFGISTERKCFTTDWQSTSKHWQNTLRHWRLLTAKKRYAMNVCYMTMHGNMRRKCSMMKC